MSQKATVYFERLNKDLPKRLEEAGVELTKTMGIDADQYVPHDTGDTRQKMITDTRKKEIRWKGEHIFYIYFGVDFNFQKDGNSKAQALWADEAIARHSDEWSKDYMDRIMEGF